MFFWIVYLLESFFNLYVILSFIHDPTERNFLMAVIFYNIYLFGYLWTLYVTLLYSGTFIVRHKDLFIEYPQSFIISYIPANFKVITQQYTGELIKIIHHPILQGNITVIRKFGDYSMTVLKYIIIWGIKAQCPQTTESNLEKIEVQFAEEPLIKSEISSIRKILNDIELVEHIHTKILNNDNKS